MTSRTGTSTPAAPPIPFWHTDTVTLYTGDALDTLSGLPAASVDSMVSSPPFYGLRDYGTGTWVGGVAECAHSVGRGTNTSHTTATDSVGYPVLPAHRGGDARTCRRCGAVRHDRQYGLEPTPDDYVDTLRAVFAEIWRVLCPTGTVWLNLGDSYSAERSGRGDHIMRSSTSDSRARAHRPTPVRDATVDRTRGLARKNLLGMPWRVATALQADGWILRNAVVWAKRNPTPESVKDRLSATYEFVFLLVKQPRYFFDLDAIRVPLARPEALGEGLVIGGANKGHQGGIDATARRRGHSVYGAKYTDTRSFAKGRPGPGIRPTGQRHDATHPRGKNPGDVWHLSTRPLREAHFAAFPIDIPLRCIAAGCPERGVVLDPFSGAATTGLAALQLGRRYVGIELNATYNRLAKTRIVRQSH